MAKKFNSSDFMNLEMIEKLHELGENPNPEDFTNSIFDCFKTPILLQTLARAIEQDKKPVIKLLARETNYRMMQLLNEESLPNSTQKN